MNESGRRVGAPCKDQRKLDSPVTIGFRAEDFAVLQSLAEERGYATVSALCRVLIKESLKREKSAT